VKTAFGAVILGILGSAVYFLPPKFEHYAQLVNTHNDLMKIRDQKKSDTAAMTRNLERFERDPEFAEKMAREHRYIFKNELLFIRENASEK